MSSSMIGPPSKAAWKQSPRITSGKTARKIAALTRLNTNLSGAVRRWTSLASWVLASMLFPPMFFSRRGYAPAVWRMPPSRSGFGAIFALAAVSQRSRSRSL